MGMNTILMLIAGIVMSTMVATQVAPSIVEGVKVKKTQVQTINNQEVIFEAIKRYTTMKQVAPTSITQLITENYIDTKVNDNGFGGTYTINVDKALGVATITTTISDPKVQEAFLNSFNSMSKPTRVVGETNKFQTKYVLPNEVMHGNALLMTGIPIQATPPDPNETKYWYDTTNGKATLKIYDKDSSSWVEVNLGSSSDEIFLPGNLNVLTLPGFVDQVGGKTTKVYEIIPSRSGSFYFTCYITAREGNTSLRVTINGVNQSYIKQTNTGGVMGVTICPNTFVAFKANDKIEILFYKPSNETGWSTISWLKIYISPDTNYPISYTKFPDVKKL
jgi:hypothetical protein